MTVAALVVSDLHLSHKPPAARCTEENWYRAQARPLRELRRLQTEHRCPLIIAGDVFDDGWRPHKCPPALINFALKWIDNAYGVPGQHDLPHHALKDLEASAFWTLCAAGKLTYLPPDEPVDVPGAYPLRLHGFPWGAELVRLREPHALFLEVAVVHHYIWRDGKGHPNAREEDRAEVLAKRLRGHEVAVFGDNHTPFTYAANGPLIYNSGAFQRRRRDEIDHRPSVGLLHANGTLKRHYLDTDHDVFADAEETAAALAEGIIDAQAIIDELNAAADADLDFAETLLRAMSQQRVPDGVRQRILGALDQGNSERQR